MKKKRVTVELDEDQLEYLDDICRYWGGISRQEAIGTSIHTEYHAWQKEIRMLRDYGDWDDENDCQYPCGIKKEAPKGPLPTFSPL